MTQLLAVAAAEVPLVLAAVVGVIVVGTVAGAPKTLWARSRRESASYTEGIDGVELFFVLELIVLRNVRQVSSSLMLFIRVELILDFLSARYVSRSEA